MFCSALNHFQELNDPKNVTVKELTDVLDSELDASATLPVDKLHDFASVLLHTSSKTDDVEDLVRSILNIDTSALKSLI